MTSEALAMRTTRRYHCRCWFKLAQKLHSAFPEASPPQADFTPKEKTKELVLLPWNVFCFPKLWDAQLT